MQRVVLIDADADTVVWSVRAFYIFATYAIIIVRFIPDLRDRFLEYGARKKLPRRVNVQFDSALDFFAKMTVPHGWFAHFYVCSTIQSAGWIYSHVQDFEYILENVSFPVVMDWHARCLLGMVLMQLQGVRRLYECVTASRSGRSSSNMWVGHYLMGLAFYLVTNVAVWFEPAFDTKDESLLSDQQYEMLLFNGVRVVVCLALFCLNSHRQFQVHRYLASLTSYQVPSHPIFEQTNLICPHYGFEVNIYMVLATLTARNSRIFNSTMLCAVLFVVINLGVTADGTKRWMMRKFPQQRSEIAKRSRMIGSIW